MTVNYAQSYQQALQAVFATNLKFADLYSTPNNNAVKWTGAKTIQVPNISTGGMVDVNRDVVGSFTRRVDNSFTPYTLEHDREFKTLVDPMDIDETNMALTIANITQVFNTEHKIPEMDKYMASKLFAEHAANGGTPDNTVLTKDNILTVFDKFMEDMDEAEVPTEGRILYVTSAINTLIKNASAIQRAMDVRGTGDGMNRSVRSLDEVKIVIVPASRMKTVYNFTDGAVADVSAKQINMILIHPSVIYAPQKYEFASVDAPSAATGGKYLYYERKYWDVFAIKQKIKGIQINSETPGP